ncbi:MAG: hypothetical protein ACPKQO_03515 [Nitrososphaeraceae archaeon]
MRDMKEISLNMERGYDNSEEKIWNNSPYKWIRDLKSSRKKGKIGELMIKEFLSDKNYFISFSPSYENDIIINGKDIEIKTSTLWKGVCYGFQQIRINQDFEYMIWFGISPFTEHCWVIPKKEILYRINKQDIRMQHAGKKGKDTAWIHVSPDNIPEWLTKWGGTMKDFKKKINILIK